MSEKKSGYEEFKVSGENLLAKVKELIHEGNVRRVFIKNDDGTTLLEIPLAAGLAVTVVATALVPVLVAVGAVAALVTQVTVGVERPGGAENAGSAGGAGSTENAGSAGGAENAGSAGGAGGAENAGSAGGAENARSAGNSGNAESSDDAAEDGIPKSTTSSPSPLAGATDPDLGPTTA